PVTCTGPPVGQAVDVIDDDSLRQPRPVLPEDWPAILAAHQDGPDDPAALVSALDVGGRIEVEVLPLAVAVDVPVVGLDVEPVRTDRFGILHKHSHRHSDSPSSLGDLLEGYSSVAGPVESSPRPSGRCAVADRESVQAGPDMPGSAWTEPQLVGLF